MTRVLCQVVGMGPAAMGVAVAADRLGLFEELAAAGLVFVDRAPGREALRSTRFPYVCESNSSGSDFLAGLRHDGRLAEVMARPAARELAAAGDAPVGLAAVHGFLNDLADEVEWQVTGSGAGEFRYGHDVAAVRCNRDDTLSTLDRAGREVATSHAVVLALGAHESEAHLPPGVRALVAGRVQVSGEVLAGRFDRVAPVVHDGDPVVILGGSHSGLSVAVAVLDRLDGMVRPGQVTIVRRGLVLGFPDAVASLPWQARLPESEWDICPDTGFVNRYRGLRGRARRLAQEVLLGDEPRVRLLDHRSPEVPDLLLSAGLVIYAAGYRGKGLRVLTPAGAEVPLFTLSGQEGVVVDRAQRVLQSDGEPLDGVYGLGIGVRRLGEGAGDRSAINFYHGDDAAHVVTQVAGVGAATCAPPATSATSVTAASATSVSTERT